MAKCRWTIVMMVLGLLCPQLLQAQGVADEIGSLQGVLEKVYDEMMPLCSKLTGVGQAIGGFAATFYIGSRVWRHIANAEPIDFFPLFRPFVLGFCIMVFPMVIAMINGLFKPIVEATSEMVKGSNKAVAVLLKQKEDALKGTDQWKMYVGESNEGDRDLWYRYTYKDADPAQEGTFASLGNNIRFSVSRMMYNMGNQVKVILSEILRILFEAAALCINTLRTFQLIVLAVIGPIAFAIAIFDGLQHTLTAWLAKYINIFLWLPVANIFGAIIGKIQEQMIKVDIAEIGSSGDTVFNSTDVAYIIFLIIGIIGYFTVPSVANSIVNAGGGDALGQKVTSIMQAAPGAPARGLTSAIDTKKSYDDGRKYDAGSGVSGALGRMSSKDSDKDFNRQRLSGNQ